MWSPPLYPQQDGIIPPQHVALELLLLVPLAALVLITWYRNLQDLSSFSHLCSQAERLPVGPLAPLDLLVFHSPWAAIASAEAAASLPSRGWRRWIFLGFLRLQCLWFPPSESGRPSVAQSIPEKSRDPSVSYRTMSVINPGWTAS